MTQKHKESGAMKLRLLSPERLLYEGEVESLIVKTQDGYEGFLKAITHGGFLYMNGDIIVYADEADWA